MDGLDYGIFDRQMRNLIDAQCAFVSGWDDLTTIEINIDLKSLCLKASRLCAMADIDYALQQSNITHMRVKENTFWQKNVDDCLCGVLSPLIVRVVKEVKGNGTITGHTSPTIPGGVISLLPQLSELLVKEGKAPDATKELINNSAILDHIMRKKFATPKYPGLDFRERFWMLYELYVMNTFLLFHFDRVCDLSAKRISKEDAGANLREMVKNYYASPEGEQELLRFTHALKFDNGGKVNLEVLEKAQIDLRKDVPTSLQTCFMKHIGDYDSMAMELTDIVMKQEEISSFVDALAKWQMLDMEIHRFKHPEFAKSELFNEVFRVRSTTLRSR